MTRESALYASGAYEGICGETPELLVNMIFDYFEAQLKAKDEEIERLKAIYYCLENDTIVLNMEQRLIDIALVLEGKLTSKEQQ